MSTSIIFVGFTSKKLILLLVVASIVGIAIGALLPALDTIITDNIRKELRARQFPLFIARQDLSVLQLVLLLCPLS